MRRWLALRFPLRGGALNELIILPLPIGNQFYPFFKLFYFSPFTLLGHVSHSAMDEVFHIVGSFLATRDE